jgi:chromosome segregation ATPase
MGHNKHPKRFAQGWEGSRGKRGEKQVSDLAELERRLTAAMARIERGVETLGSGPGDEMAALEADRNSLRAALEEEKTANAQLEARVQTLKEREASLSASAAQSEAMQDRLATLDGEMQALKQVVDQMRANSQALRTANAEGVADPALINRALQVELDSLKAERAVEQKETAAVIAELKPLVEGMADATG